MSVQCHVYRDAGHPSDDGREGFDLLYLSGATDEEVEIVAREAEIKRFWHVWLIGSANNNGVPGGVLYKPSGIEMEWIDTPASPYRAVPATRFAQGAQTIWTAKPPAAKVNVSRMRYK